MTMSVAGQLLRHLGRAIEVVCLLALLAVYRGQWEFWKKHGIDPSITLTLCFGLGIIIWATGTYLMVRAKKQPR
jgi:hypothetical protein